MVLLLRVKVVVGKMLVAIGYRWRGGAGSMSD
jgi:hypothetical protein